MAGEFYGIQKYVLGITAAGGGQAKRLRARSFVVQALEQIVVEELRALGSSELIMAGGGQFVLALENSQAAQPRLLEFRRELQERLFKELGGELSFNLGWSDSIEQARHARELERRRPWAEYMTGPNGWAHERMRLGNIYPPCDICGKRRETVTWSSDGPPESVCERCNSDRSIGTQIPHVQGVELAEHDSDIQLLGRGLRFRHASSGAAVGDGGRALHRYVPVQDDRKTLLTFEEIAAKAEGDELLGILKADVDSFGRLIAKHTKEGTLDALERVSKDLDGFFSITLQRAISENAEWKYIYTVFSGGDDLLLVGPWSVMLDFAATVESMFSSGPGRQYGLSLSAAVSFMPPRIPIRHGVHRAETDLKQAKGGSKNHCATLGGVWDWEDFRRILGKGRQLVKWWTCGVKKALLRRLYHIAASAEPGAQLWAWELGRNFPPRNSPHDELRLFREWGDRVLANWEAGTMNETRAALLYALTATRMIRSKDERRGR
ncbi:MAG: hypothetical protein LAP87_05045 [Acidobacteriia bacterium]|nr:hypothetical protein [Terriglobia bacterium]